jgi:hypothetical protein
MNPTLIRSPLRRFWLSWCLRGCTRADGRRRRPSCVNALGRRTSRRCDSTGPYAERKRNCRIVRSGLRSSRSAIWIAEREHFSGRWHALQSRFVDDPKGAVTEADALVSSLMQTRGYPVADFDQRAADISVDHPDVVANYRSAHEIALRLERRMDSFA